MVLTHILVERRMTVKEAMTELQNNKHETVCWLGNYWINWYNRQIVYSSQAYDGARNME
jgi:hypothetical protein